MYRIFISYKRVDKDMVFPIKDAIESEIGEKCWIDLDGIESDAQFKNVIIKAINQCEILLFMYSKQHLKIVDFEKDWTFKELNFAQKKNKRIIFVNIDGSPLSDEFEFDFGTKQQIDAQNKERLNKLICDLQKWLSVESHEDNSSSINRIVCEQNVEYALTLLDAGCAKLQVVKLFIDSLNWNLRTAMDFVNAAPSSEPIVFPSKEEAMKLYLKIDELGGSAIINEIKCS